MVILKDNETQEGAGVQKLLADLRDANEQLLLAGLRAQESADQAMAARVRAEETARRLEEIERELRATAEFREQLLAIVGHDLRNPLGAIIMAAGLLLRNGHLGEADGRLVARIINSSQRMTRMITELRDFTRARLGGGLPLFLNPVDLSEICLNVVSELELTTIVVLRCELDGDLRGTWDGDRLYQLISNLVGNAIDYATPTTPVAVRARVDGAEVVVEVCNAGVPIPPETMRVIFEPFRRGGKDEKTGVTHLGLGLYIAHQIALAHGGALTAQSAGGTTTFALRLPRPPAEAKA